MSDDDSALRACAWNTTLIIVALVIWGIGALGILLIETSDVAGGVWWYAARIVWSLVLCAVLWRLRPFRQQKEVGK